MQSIPVPKSTWKRILPSVIKVHSEAVWHHHEYAKKGKTDIGTENVRIITWNLMLEMAEEYAGDIRLDVVNYCDTLLEKNLLSEDEADNFRSFLPSLRDHDTDQLLERLLKKLADAKFPMQAHVSTNDPSGKAQTQKTEDNPSKTPPTTSKSQETPAASSDARFHEL